MRSPGAIIAVVNTPARHPALNSWTALSSCSGVFCCRRLPMPKPKKHTANMGVTPMRGAAIPMKFLKLFQNSTIFIFKEISKHPSFKGTQHSRFKGTSITRRCTLQIHWLASKNECSKCTHYQIESWKIETKFIHQDEQRCQQRPCLKNREHFFKVIYTHSKRLWLKKNAPLMCCFTLNPTSIKMDDLIHHLTFIQALEALSFDSLHSAVPRPFVHRVALALGLQADLGNKH